MKRRKKPVTAILDVGGGLRDFFGCGILDTLLEEGVNADLAFGISAGAGNLSSYLAGQQGRNHAYYIEYSKRPEYMSMQNLAKKGIYLDLDYVYSTLSNSDGENPLDFEALQKSRSRFVVQTTNALTGKPARFGKDRLKQDEYELFKCSSALPFATRPFYLAGFPHFDGGIADPIPLDALFEMGTDKVLLILTRPKDQERKVDKDRLFARMLRRHHPMVAKALEKRAENYNRGLERARELEREGKVLILAPDSIGHLKTLSNKTEDLEALYEEGRKKGLLAKEFLQN